MHDIDVIAKKNQEAVAKAAAAAAAEGKLVLYKFSGLHFVGYSTHNTEAERNQAAIDWNNASPTHRVAYPAAN